MLPPFLSAFIIAIALPLTHPHTTLLSLRSAQLVEHQRAVQAMIDDKRRMYMEQKAREEAELAARRAEDERRLAIVEAERRILLAEAAELREFLPRGVLRDQGDVEYINQVLASQRIR